MADTLINCSFALRHADNSGTPINEIIRKNQKDFGNAVGTPQADPQKMPKVKKNDRIILMQDDYLILATKILTAFTEAAATSVTQTYKIPVTVRNIRTDFRYEDTLTDKEMTAVKTFANNQVHGISGDWETLQKYKIPAQTELKVGHNLQDVRVDGAMNLYWSADLA